MCAVGPVGSKEEVRWRCEETEFAVLSEKTKETDVLNKIKLMDVNKWIITHYRSLKATSTKFCVEQYSLIKYILWCWFSGVSGLVEVGHEAINKSMKGNVFSLEIKIN